MKKIIYAVVVTVFFVSPAFACGGGPLTGGSTEVTQLANNVLLGDIFGKDAAIAVNTANQYTKQLQQYATQLQQFAEAVKSNFSVPFQIYNDLKNSATGIYSSIKGTGEGVYSYANADNWMNDMKNRTGWLAQYQYQQKSNKATMKTINDIITKDESEAALAKDAEDASNAATGDTAAIQAGNRIDMLMLAAIKNQTALEATKQKNDTDSQAADEERRKQLLEIQDKYIEGIANEAAAITEKGD